MFTLPRDEQKADGIPTSVVFRRFRRIVSPDKPIMLADTFGELIALFPFIPANDNATHCMSYQHVGQHGAADYRHMMEITIPVLPEDEEKMALKVELENIGYELEEFTNEEACFEAGYKYGQNENA